MQNYYNLKHFYFYTSIVLFILISASGFSQNFRVISFEEDLSDLSAVKYARTDVNDEQCAIIKVYTNLDALFFETRLGIEGDIVNKTGEFWIYVSPREKQLKIIKNGFIPLEYAIPINIEEAKVYKMTLTDGNTSELETSPDAQNEFVVFETNPAGAQVYIGGQLKGVTPLSIPMLEGNYSCRIEMPLYKTEEFDLCVKAGNTINIHKTLDELEIYGNLRVSTNSFADIYIDNQKVATGSYSGRLIEGLHIVKIQAENYLGYTKDFLVVVNRDYVIDEVLEAKLGVISVQSEPLGANIFIDGEFVGTTPKFVRDVKAGNRRIIVEKEGYASVDEKIFVEYDKTKEFVYQLKDAKKFILSTRPTEADVYVNDILVGKSPLELDIDFKRHNKIKIVKEGCHTVYDEIPMDSQLKEKSYHMEKLGLSGNASNKSKTTPVVIKKKRDENRDFKANRTDVGWSISGLNARPGGISSTVYVNFGERKQLGAYIEGGYQINNYNNSHIDGFVSFPRYSFGVSYNLWISDIVVLELFGGIGREYALDMDWKDFTIWDMPPESCYVSYCKGGIRAAVRVSPHIEVFSSYNFNNCDGPAVDIWGDQVEISGVKYNYQTLFPDRTGENWELGVRFVLY